MLSNLNREQQLANLRHDEAIRRASRSSQQQGLASGGAPITLPHRSVLAKVGQILSSVGDTLQQRYGEPLQPVTSNS
jgi:hypothetical protein